MMKTNLSQIRYVNHSKVYVLSLHLFFPPLPQSCCSLAHFLSWTAL
uniref:Uncharacterized protein n=1 Tax=Anguilla anguilla TaxID=7936 RepID=A0A0E9USV1_ANGAN